MVSIFRYDYEQIKDRIIRTYDSAVVRAYCKVRFTIINMNILHILAICLRGKQKVLDIGCGFGIFACYFSTLYPWVSYCGYDIDSKRIEVAKQTASRLGLNNVTFCCNDVRQLNLDDKFDAILMIDLLHHIDEDSKHGLLATCASHLEYDGIFIIKDVTTHPFLKISYNWVLDVLVTRSFQMWYWDEEKFHKALGKHFSQVHTFPIKHWLPYPHILYLCEKMHL